MISNQMNLFCETHFIFRENFIILQGDKLPDDTVMRKCLEHNAASDWFAETDYGYSAILLEKDSPNPAGCKEIPLREFFHEMNNVKMLGPFESARGDNKFISGHQLVCLASRARGLLNFRSTKRYCAKCGGVLQDDNLFTARTCVLCGKQYFPQIEPAIIVLVSKGDELLLARHKNRNDDVYSCLAGFVETGETIEQTVRREVFEEVGIKIKDVRYVGSQSWPFPDQLMLAFRAEYESGEITNQEDELKDAAWFSRDKLPKVPGPGSVAHNLINGKFD